MAEYAETRGDSAIAPRIPPFPRIPRFTCRSKESHIQLICGSGTAFCSDLFDDADDVVVCKI
jgi:hypothetical protein